MLSTLRLAWRNAARNPRRTGVVIAAVAIGMAGTLVSMAIFYGMMFQMVDNAIKTDLGHVQIHASGYDADPEIGLFLADGAGPERRALATDPAVQASSVRIRSEGLVTSPSASVGVRVIGVDAEAERSVSMVGDAIVSGAYFAKKRTAVIGEGLARRLGVEVGNKIVISVQDLAGDMTGESLRVGGIFRTPSAQLDRGTLFLSLTDAASLFGMNDAVTEVVIVAHSRDEVPALQARLVAALPGREIKRWDEIEPILASILTVMDQMAWGLYLTIFIAMSFGIANVLMMAIFERIREFGILLAVGLSRRRLFALVVGESLMVTGVGMLVGFGLAGLFLFALSDGIDMSGFAEGLGSFGIGTHIVPVLTRNDFTIPAVVAVATALVASAWPAIRAVRLRPAEAVRHD